MNENPNPAAVAHVEEGEATLAVALTRAQVSPARVALIAEAQVHFTAALAHLALGAPVVGPDAEPADEDDDLDDLLDPDER